MIARVLGLALLSGCAAAPPAQQLAPAEPPGALSQARAHAEELERAEAQLGPRAGVPTAPTPAAVDCPGARAIVQRICALAEHICELGDEARTPEDKAEIARLCADGRARCARARANTEERCALASPTHPFRTPGRLDRP